MLYSITRLLVITLKNKAILKTHIIVILHIQSFITNQITTQFEIAGFYKVISIQLRSKSFNIRILDDMKSSI